MPTSCAVTTRASGRRRTRSFLVTSGPVCDPDEGAAALGFAVGDRVAGTSHDACGFCKKCVEGRYNLCENYGNTDVHRHYGHNYQGAFAECVVDGVKSGFHLPDELSFHEGALLDPVAIALHTAGGMLRAIPQVSDGRTRVNELHTHTFPLDEFRAAIDTFNERRDGALKVIIEP